jgi:hypothetical protein
LGGAILWWTNFVRFGDGFEFGHKLNLQSAYLIRNIYASRFDYPFQNEPLGLAMRELFGALFQAGHPNSHDPYARALFPGQSPTFRWRNFSDSAFLTYDLSYLPIIVAGWVGGILSGWKCWKDCQMRPGNLSVNAVLAFWSFSASFPLAVFYLRGPFIASRYMMDFAPAFAFAIVVAWRCIVGMLPVSKLRLLWIGAIAYAVLLAWLGEHLWETNTSATSTFVRWKDVAQEREATLTKAAALPLPSSYQLGTNLDIFGIPYNGTGWNIQTGALSVCVILFVERPEFLELELTSAPGAQTSRSEAEHIRAKVGLEFLKQESVEPTAKGWRVRFSGPKRPDYQRGIQPVFIATVPTECMEKNETPWILNKVTWR